MYLGIEIGGTKLQLAVGGGDGSPLTELQRLDVVSADGAGGILRQIENVAGELIRRHRLRAIGIGFGGPVDGGAGRVVKSHHVDGWDGFELAAWCREKFGLPTVVENDCDVAGLAEAKFGAGQGRSPVFYLTVGTGIGGGLILDGEIYRGHGQAAAELGHLRPGLDAGLPEQNLESLAAGWGIASQAAARIQRSRSAPAAGTNIAKAEVEATETADLLGRCGETPDKLTAQIVAEAAAAGNGIAAEVLSRATAALGWGIAQVITLLSPEVVVIGGGVSMLGEERFFMPLRKSVAHYVFPPLRRCYEIVPAALAEQVVLHGALALASNA